MGEPPARDVLNYALNSDIAVIKKRGDKELNKLVINNVEYNYNKDKEISNRLKRKLNQISKTQGYKRHTILKRASQGIAVRKALKKYAIKQKAKITDEKSAFSKYANSFYISNINLKGYRGLSYIKYQEPRLKEFLQTAKNMKIRIDVDIAFNHPEEEEGERRIRIPSRIYTVLNDEELKKDIDNMASDIEIKVENSQLRKSGYTIKKVDGIHIHYDKYNPTRGSKYIELPRWVALKKACINIKNDDEYCFKYCVQSKFYDIYKQDHPDRMYHYNKLRDSDHLINWEGISFPVSKDDIDKFEEINQNSISVNVYKINPDVDKIIVHRITKVIKPSCHINLLLIEKDGLSHYTLIKDYSRLMGSQTNKHREKLFHCMYCQKGFNSEKLQTAHLLKGCMKNEVQNIEMPETKEKMHFKNHYKKLKCPYVIYGDFECLTTKSDEGIKGCYQHHKPCGFMLNVVNSITNEATPYLYRGEDCMDKFCSTMNNIRADIMKKMKTVKKIDITKKQEEEHKRATRCCICNGTFNQKDPAKTKVQDHCHFTGLYRGAAHNKCNLDFCFRYFKIPVFFHNLKNYDAHLIISHFDKLNTDKDDVSVIAQNSEKYITFSLKQLEFKDSFSFLSSSLDKLVKLTKYEGNEKRKDWDNHFYHSNKNLYVNNVEDLDLLTDKGVYPYDYMTDFSKFKETQLPDKEEFYSKLTESNIKDDEYERAQHIWKHFNIQNLGQYHDLYLQTDVLLLTDVFENFRNKCLEDYNLDPAHYLTLPNFSWDAMLLKTGICLDLIYDEEVYKMVASGLRGGMRQVSHRKAEANNKYMEDDYDKSKESSYINYLDANNLYGLAMCKKLPYKDIKFDNILTEEDILNYDNGDLGYILDVDLEYPKELHDKHIDYPLAPQIMNVTADMLSDVQKDIYKQYNFNKDVKDEDTKKLILNVMDKNNYVVHIQILKYYLKEGLKLKKVNRVISFQQKCWLKPWIDFNTNKRKNATSDFEKDMYKLMNNAVYGKTMENVREHINFELVDTPERYAKCVNNPTFKNRHIINESLVGVEKLRETVKLNKPIYVGMSILDLSKLHMYSFYYDVLKEKYQENIRLIYTDTDSFVLHIKTEDVYDDFKEIKHEMDFSGYDKSHKCYDNTNKKVLGKFKDECDGKIITHFIGLKPKSYAFKIHKEKKEEKKSKGIVKHKVKNELHYKSYEKTLLENDCDKVEFNSIRSKNHQIYTIRQVKQALSSYDNKRYYLDSVNSLPYGHFKTQ